MQVLQTMMMDEHLEQAIRIVRKEIAPVWENGNNNGSKSWAPPDLQSRITWALSKKRDKYTIAIIVDKDNSWASRKAEEIRKQLPASIVKVTTGMAHSSKPVDPCSQNAIIDDEVMPGISIGHGRGLAGTMGCLIRVKTKKHGEYIAATTAAHVIGLSKGVKEGDRIFSPAKPDCGVSLKLSNIVGEVADLSALEHYIDKDDDKPPYHSIDIAIIKLRDDLTIPSQNYVPSPSDPVKKRIPIKTVIPADDLWKKIGKPVYKIGRTSHFTKGILEYVNIGHRLIRLRNNRNYLYSELIGVRWESNIPFSKPGDSGALVYSPNGEALGFVVGADDEITLCCSAEKALADFDAQLL